MTKSFLFLNLFILSSLPLTADTCIKTVIQTPNAAQPVGPFSQAISISNPQKIVFISGQLPIYPDSNTLETDPAKATAQCMHNLLAILTAAEMNFNNVVDTTILLTDLKDFAVVNAVYESFLTAPYPARLTFQAAALPKGACVEIKMTAVK